MRQYRLRTLGLDPAQLTASHSTLPITGLHLQRRTHWWTRLFQCAAAPHTVFTHMDAGRVVCEGMHTPTGKLKVGSEAAAGRAGAEVCPAAQAVGVAVTASSTPSASRPLASTQPGQPHPTPRSPPRACTCSATRTGGHASSSAPRHLTQSSHAWMRAGSYARACTRPPASSRLARRWLQDVLAPRYDQLHRWVWWVLEVLPLPHRHQRDDNGRGDV